MVVSPWKSLVGTSEAGEAPGDTSCAEVECGYLDETWTYAGKPGRSHWFLNSVDSQDDSRIPPRALLSIRYLRRVVRGKTSWAVAGVGAVLVLAAVVWAFFSDA